MKILVCTDGSLQSQKTLEETAKLAAGLNVNEVTVIHVYGESDLMPSAVGSHRISDEGYKIFLESFKKEGKEILQQAVKYFAEKDIKAKTILKRGHAANTIAKVANEEGYDLLVIGSRGHGGLKRLYLGSVSNAVLQEVHINVFVVK